MIFYRKQNTEISELPMRVKRVRYLSVASLVAYPVGAISNLIGSIHDILALEIIGLLLVVVALFAFVGVIGTGVQRIAADETDKLDPVELDLRQKTYARAYHWVGAIALLSVLYLSIASDTQDKIGLWIPTNFDHWNAIMWGGILVIMVLPTTLLAWSLPEEEILDDEA